ncbi:MAG: SMP-30/gluconolactonase/LRE family protein [Gammaproteobacteria bacterium]|nr:SMP-30/gluconolactonase/LRE family protein [Gammaproteobacteria bacterium]
MPTEVRDSRLNDIVEPNVELEVLGENFGFTEGPIWHPQDKHLTFSDIPSNRMHRWSAANGLSVYREPSQYANGNTYDKQGRILTCEHGTSRVVRQEADGSLNILASHWDGKELNSPNDIVVHSNGDIFFTDPTFGRSDASGIERPLELDITGVYKIDAHSGQLQLLRSDFTQPNGLAFTQDEQHLYVADTPQMHIRKFAVDEDGSLSGGEIFAHETGQGAGAPDGLKVDSLGNVYCCGPGGVQVFFSDGTCLGVIQTPAFCANFTWGGDDLLTFFLTSSNHLYRIPVKVPGVALF